MRMLQRMKMSLVSVLSIGAAMLCSISAWADTWTDSSGNVWGYRVVEDSVSQGPKTVTIVTNISFATTDITIPSEIDDASVTEIGRFAFSRKPIMHVTIPDTVTNLSDSAFAGCDRLVSVTINGASLKTIGVTVFKDCRNLKSFVMPDSVETVGDGMFSCCASLESVTLSDKLATLPGIKYHGTDLTPYLISYADTSHSISMKGDGLQYGFFYNCTSLKTINWGKSIKTIGNIAFLNCSALESVVIPDTVTGIGYHAFMGCDRLRSVKIGENVLEIGRMAFCTLPNLTEVQFGSKVEKIGARAFEDCANLHNFTLPGTVRFINEQAFSGCSRALTFVDIPKNTNGYETELGHAVFSGCESLETVTFGDTVKTVTGVKFSGVGVTPYRVAYSETTDEKNLIKGEEYGFFYNCKSLKNINWGKGIETIGNIAFLNCSALEKVEIPDTVVGIGSHAFLGCTNLSNVKIGNKVTNIWRRAFSELPRLSSVTFGAKVEEIADMAFKGCHNLQNFTLPSSILRLGHQSFANCSKALTAVTIPTNKDGLETVLDCGVFSGCESLETVTFGDTVKAIPGAKYSGLGTTPYGIAYSEQTRGDDLIEGGEHGFFYNCKSLRDVNFGAEIREIGNIAFLNCSALTDIAIPAKNDTIGNHAFYGCTSLKSVVAEGSIISIGRKAFGDCPALHYVDFRGQTMDYEPDAEIFALCKDRVTVFAAEGSTGWTGVAGVAGLPESGTWCGVRITYAPPPEGAGNPYDFYPDILTDRVNRKYHEWSAPVLLTTNHYVNGKTIPATCSTILEGSTVYLSYVFNEYWRGEAFTVTNRFTLSGAKSGTFDLSLSMAELSTDSVLWETNATPALLQNLVPGNYMLTLSVNGDDRLAETDYSNNSTSIAFTVVGVPKYTVSFNLNGATGAAPASRTIYEGQVIGELPTVTAPAGWTFLGWYTAATGGTKITSSKVVNAPFVCYARWEKRDMGFYTPSSQKGWTQPFFLASSSSDVAGKTQFANGESIYVKYAFTNLAGDYDVGGFINRFTLTGDKSATFDDDWSKYKLKAGTYDDGNWAPSALQNLPAGTYTITCTLDATGVIAETNEGNNTRFITFTIGSDNGGGSGNGNSDNDNGNGNGGTNPGYALFDKVSGIVSDNAASVYDGYLYHFDQVAGTIQVKVSKPKKGSAKISATIQIVGEKKVSVKGELDVASGKLEAVANDGRKLYLEFGSNGMTGSFGDYVVDGARNFFSSKDKAEKAEAEDVLAPWLGVLNMKCGNGTLSIAVAKKGKVTVKGEIGGAKVSAKAQALIGEDAICIPVAYSKKGVNLAFTLWLPLDGGKVEVVGMDGDPIVGKAGTIKDGAVFAVNGDILSDIPSALTEIDGYALLPDGESVAVSGKKWVVADGVKAAKVAHKKGVLSITEGKKGEGIANPSQLKLTYKAKDGSFKGSFYVYTLENGKFKKQKATVTGVMIDGVGYGTATIKKLGSWNITIK